MIESIELKNWKVHHSTKIKFSPGVNIIMGVMGSGKSSILDAISFALFGTFPSLKEHRVTLKDIITHIPAQESSAEVRLFFSSGNETYEVIRKVQPTGASASLLKDGKFVQTQSERVNDEIASILKVDYDTFARAIYSRQNSLEYFLDIDRSKRKKNIDEMLGLEAFSIAEDNTTSLINSIKASIEGKQAALSGMDIEKELAELASNNAQKKGLEDEIAELQKKEKEYRESFAAKNAQLQLLQKAYKEKKAIDDKVLSLSSKNAILQKEIDKIINVKDAASISAELEKAAIEEKDGTALLKQASQRKLELSRQRSSAEAAISQLEADIKKRDSLISATKGKDIQEMQSLLAQKEKELDALKGSIAANASLINEEKEWLGKLKGISKCPLCERPLEPAARERIIEGKKATIIKLDEASKAYSANADMASKEVLKLRNGIEETKTSLKRLKEYDGIDEKLAGLLKVKAELGAKITEEEKSEEELEGKLDAIRQRLNAIKADKEKADRRLQYSRELLGNNAEIEKLKAQSSIIVVDENAIYSLNGIITKESARLAEASSAIASKSEYLSKLERDIKLRTESIERYRKIEKGIHSMHELHGELGKFKAALANTEAVLRADLANSINSIMQSIWPELYPYGDYTAVRLNVTDNDYLLEMLSNSNGEEQWHSVDAIASGGERSIACLAMRIAFAMVVVPNLKWLILDEPTHNIDSNGIERFISVLGNNLPKIVEQVFVITHAEELKQISNANLYILDRDKSSYGYATVSKI